jgi:uncharacterized membrane protein (UPF0136 family)
MIVARVFLVYGILLYIEAAVGWRNSGNRQTMIAGIAAGSILMTAAILVGFELQQQLGSSIGVGATLAMTGNFGSRFSKSRKFVPAGLMLAISVVTLGILVTQVFG